jgi:hypothetical protein
MNTTTRTREIIVVILISILFILPLTIVGILTIEVLSKILFRENANQLLLFVLISFYTYFIIFLSVRYLTKKYLKEDVMNYRKPSSMSFRGTYAWILAGVGMAIIAKYLSWYLVSALPENLANVGRNTSPIYDSSSGLDIIDSGVRLLFNGILTPIFEEIYFRGFVLRMMLLKFGFLNSFLVTAMVFVIFHPIPAYIPAYFIVQLINCLAFYKTRKLFAPITFHIAYNTTLDTLVKYVLRPI